MATVAQTDGPLTRFCCGLQYTWPDFRASKRPSPSAYAPQRFSASLLPHAQELTLISRAALKPTQIRRAQASRAAARAGLRCGDRPRQASVVDRPSRAQFFPPVHATSHTPWLDAHESEGQARRRADAEFAGLGCEVETYQHGGPAHLFRHLNVGDRVVKQNTCPPLAHICRHSCGIHGSNKGCGAVLCLQLARPRIHNDGKQVVGRGRRKNFSKTAGRCSPCRTDSNVSACLHAWVCMLPWALPCSLVEAVKTKRRSLLAHLPIISRSGPSASISE